MVPERFFEILVTLFASEFKHPKEAVMMSTAFYVGWGTLTLINAGLAQSKIGLA